MTLMAHRKSGFALGRSDGGRRTYDLQVVIEAASQPGLLTSPGRAISEAERDGQEGGCQRPFTSTTTRGEFMSIGETSTPSSVWVLYFSAICADGCVTWIL